MTNGNSPAAQSNFLYRNDGSTGANHWLHVRCVGVASNRSAIGARVRVKATIGGSPVWQLREISSQTGYNSMNSLAVEFGLGDATVVDSLVVDWPSGTQDVVTSLPVDGKIRLVEGSDPTSAPLAAGPAARLGAAPNPFREATDLTFSLSAPARVSLVVVDVTGRRVATLVDARRTAGIHRARLPGGSLPAGVYFAVLRVGAREESRRLIRLR